jgi:hypothetical protein
MLQYWTFWNYVWWSSYKNNMCELSPALRCSILTTSMIGGYMVYIYPRKFIIRINDKKFLIPYIALICGDFYFHQYPLFDMISNYDCYTNNNCGGNVIVPFISWYSLLTISGVRKHKIYGINLHYLIGACGAITTLYGLKYHTTNLLQLTNFKKN